MRGTVQHGRFIQFSGNIGLYVGPGCPGNTGTGKRGEDITGLYEDNDFIKKESDKNRKEIKDIQKRLEYCYQKMGMVKYDAFSQMGGQLSFCLCLLNEKDDGFILNSVQSSDGCYTYTKEVKKGECAITLGAEEKEALDKAIGY